MLSSKLSKPGRPSLVLASASPRRQALMEQVGFVITETSAADIDETPHKGEKPHLYATRMACEKAAAVKDHFPNAYIIAADTVVSLGARILPKALDEKDALTSIKLLSGRRHRVYTGHCVLTPNGRFSSKVSLTRVAFKRLTEQEIDNYITSKEWQGKAGGYAIQGLAASFIHWINGSYTNVVGLDVALLKKMVIGLGYPFYESA